MNAAQEIMGIIYAPDQSDEADDQYQESRKLYFILSDKLNASVRNDPAKMAALSVIAQYLFIKRNSVSINLSPTQYRNEQGRVLPLGSPQFFREVKSFLEVLGTSCALNAFDNAVLMKIDLFTQALYTMRDRRYLELKDFFFRLENCDTPLDLLFRGLFVARAKQNVRKLRWTLIAVIGLIILLVMFLQR